MPILLAKPRGFCAGVDRAIEIVERALQIHGAPIYVRHEVVHNKFVTDDLRSKGAVFVEDLSRARRIAGGAPRSRGARPEGVRCNLPAGDQGARRGRQDA